MNELTIFQCFPAYQPAATTRIINSIPESQAKILIDLEDSISDFENPGLSVQMKEKARVDLKLILSGISRQKVSLRINSVNSDDYLKDKVLLHTFADRFEYVFVPKTTGAADILKLYNEFGNLFRICPIVESKSGMENLPSLIELKTWIEIEFIFFGNYDYHLDQDKYPITEQCDPGYWELILPMIRMLESAGINFGNSPYANIGDLETIKHIYHQLKHICSRRFACVTLHRTQTEQLNNLLSGKSNSTFRENLSNQQVSVTEMFKAGKLKGRSFAFNRNMQIITPQEYILSGKHAHK